MGYLMRLLDGLNEIMRKCLEQWGHIVGDQYIAVALSSPEVATHLTQRKWRVPATC